MDSSRMFVLLAMRRCILHKHLFAHHYVSCCAVMSGQKLPQNLTDDSCLKSQYDCIVIGAGHNGLIAATYLQKAGLDVCVLERRHIIGGAAVTEELVPGFKFSRASYLLSLLRPQIIKDLELMKYGLKLFFQDPHSYTPVFVPGNRKCKQMSLSLGRNREQNMQQIAQFSKKDAKAYADYERQLEQLVDAIDPLLDVSPVHVPTWTERSTLGRKLKNWPSVKALLMTARKLRGKIPIFYELLTAPAAAVLDKWFVSEPLKATLATDSVIGAMTSPQLVGSGYVLLHHVMGGFEGNKGAWAYIEGGMGALSNAIAQAARHAGADIFVNKQVSKVLVHGNNYVEGVVTSDGTAISAKMVLSNATPHITFLELLDKKYLPEEFVKDISHIDYTSPVTKINVAVRSIPNFLACPNKKGQRSQPHHQATIHLNCEEMSYIHDAYLDAQRGIYSQKPVIEMTIPSSLDPTLAPPDQHVVQLFTQYTPYTLAGGQEWTEELKDKYTNLVFESIERYAPGFMDSVIGVDILTPTDLEREFSLTGGNIFHGSMALHQLYSQRPLPAYSDTRSPISGLYLCGSGAHPGGGIMGSPGRLAAITALLDWKNN